MVSVINQHQPAKLCNGLAGTVMLPALKFSLDSFQLCHHPLLSRNPSYGKSAAAIALPSKVGETQVWPLFASIRGSWRQRRFPKTRTCRTGGRCHYSYGPGSPSLGDCRSALENVIA